MDKKDEIVMKLVHFLVTKENYTPIVVNGVKNEVWLENTNGPYKIVRINSNYVHNKEQYNFDIYKTNSVAKQIKKKTLSWKMNVLNIFLDLNEDVKINNNANISSIRVEEADDLLHNELIVDAFPNIEKDMITASNDIDLIVNVTNDINSKTAKENRRYEEVFKPKPIIVTNILIGLCILVFILQILFPNITYMFANYGAKVKEGEIYRLITSMFLHGSIWHLLCNMVSLWCIGREVETYLGRTKYLAVYLLSGLLGSLFSCVFNSGLSVGASGAIFGLLGCLLFFGYYYRLYLNRALTREIIPVIILNLALSLAMPSIDLACHLGGLIGGVFATMALGIKNKSDNKTKINGWIILIILILFTSYLLFLR